MDTTSHLIARPPALSLRLSLLPLNSRQHFTPCSDKVQIHWKSVVHRAIEFPFISLYIFLHRSGVWKAGIQQASTMIVLGTEPAFSWVLVPRDIHQGCQSTG